MNTKGRPRNKGVAFTGEKISALYEEGLSNSTVLRQEAYCKGTECLMAGDGQVKAVRTLLQTLSQDLPTDGDRSIRLFPTEIQGK